jgi:transposase
VDRAYNSDGPARNLADHGAWANVKPMPNRKNVPAFSGFRYRYRNLIERFFNKLQHFQAVSTRYDKYTKNYLASVELASARLCMRFDESMT